MSVVPGRAGSHRQVKSSTWLLEEGFSMLAGSGSLEELRLLRRTTGLTLELDPRYWHRSGKVEIATEA